MTTREITGCPKCHGEMMSNSYAYQCLTCGLTLRTLIEDCDKDTISGICDCRSCEAAIELEESHY